MENYQLITPALAHVTTNENLLISKVRSTKDNHVFEGEFIIDGTHPYLYENSAIANHVSGTTFIDVGRQLLKAISHLFYEAPMENRFVLHNVNCEFVRWAKINVQIHVKATIEVSAKRTDSRRSFKTSLVFTQEDKVVVLASCNVTTFSHDLETKLMSRQYNG